LFHTTPPLALVTVNAGEVGPIPTLQFFFDTFRTDHVITTNVSGA
jgi:hypothetical protein